MADDPPEDEPVEDDPLALANRTGLPDALRVLLAEYPRDLWTSHRNFDGLTRFWLERHLGFRQLMDGLQGRTRVFLDRPGDPRAEAQQVHRMASALIQHLQGHHQIEDQHYFPVLAAAETRLERGFDILDADHHALDAQLHALAEATNGYLRALIDGPGSHDAAGAFEARLSGFERLLDRHLSDEEDLVVPVILHHAPRL
ncbi:hemerythrin domain-containing protein [Pararhodobacter sp. SW119]|uniref:hemerythrin domain-containing protein n=1 Tax=Pararhodobacter sp. SW119 TaxID=2780075 RepID=UPI001ADF98A5|nr:hemerythrin domain-containing protein [Pararhodobacter sp. SW119]